MLCRHAIILCLALAASLVGSRAEASGPALGIDLDTSIPGAQTNAVIGVGETLVVEVLASDLAVGEGLHAYELDVDFDPAVVSASQLEAGDVLSTPIVLEQDTTDPDVNFAATETGPNPSTSDGALIRFEIEGLSEGTTTLRLNDVVLSTPHGGFVLPTGVSNATIAVPEPELMDSPWALGLLFALFSLFQRRRRYLVRQRPSATALSSLVCLMLLAGVARAIVDPPADINSDGYVDILDASIVSSCLGEDPSVDRLCNVADVDEDLDVDPDDLDFVALHLGGITGPPFESRGALYDCERDGFPCNLLDTPDAIIARTDILLADAASQLSAGASLPEVAQSLAAEPDVERVDQAGWSIVFQVAGGPPASIHNGACARRVEHGWDLYQPASPTAPSLPDTRIPTGHRVIGRDGPDPGDERDRAKRALLLSPYFSDFDPFDSAVNVTPIFQAIDDYQQGAVDTAVGPAVQISHYLDWDEYDVVFMSTHGDSIAGEINAARLEEEWIYLGDFAGTCAQLKQQLAPLPGEGPIDGITCGIVNVGDCHGPPQFDGSIEARPRFFQRRYPQGLTNSFVWLDACRSHRLSGLRRALMGTHSVFLGWDDYVFSDTSDLAAREILDLAATKGLRTSRAWTLKCEEGLCFDSYQARTDLVNGCIGQPLTGDCVSADYDDDGDIDADDITAISGGNSKEAELIYAFDEADQRLREVVQLAAPPPDMYFGGICEDGSTAGDFYGFAPGEVLFEGFEAEDFTNHADPAEFIANTTLFTFDLEDEDLQSELPLVEIDQVVEASGPPEDYRWTNKAALMLPMVEDLSNGQTLTVEMRLRFPPTVGTPDQDKSYALPFDTTLSCPVIPGFP